MTERTALLFCIVATAALTDPPRAHASGVPSIGLEPVGPMFVGALGAGGVLLGEAILGADVRYALIEPPFSWINVIAGVGVCSYVAATEPSYSANVQATRYALATGGTLLAIHGIVSLLGYREPEPAPEFAVAISTDLFRQVGFDLRGTL